MSRVMAAEACPSISCTALTLAPAAIARLAAVWRSSCGVSPSSPTLLRSRIEEPRPEVRIAQHPALWSGKHQIGGGLPGQAVRQLVGQEAGDRNRASLMGLGRADDHPTVNFGDRFDDLDPAPGQVDPAGGQGHELAPAQAGVGQDSDERVVRRAGLGQRLYLIMSEEALGRSHKAGEGYALGDVPDEPSVADSRCEAQRQDAVGVPNGCRSKSLVGQAVHPARNVRVGDPGQRTCTPHWSCGGEASLVRAQSADRGWSPRQVSVHRPGTPQWSAMKRPGRRSEHRPGPRSPRAANTPMACLMEQLRGRRDRRAHAAHDDAVTELRPADPDLRPPAWLTWWRCGFPSSNTKPPTLHLPIRPKPVGCLPASLSSVAVGRSRAAAATPCACVWL